MVYISKVYTKAGDRGETTLGNGLRVRKDAARVAAFGDVDELNAIMGLLRLELTREQRDGETNPVIDALDGQFARIQQELFNLGGELATPPIPEKPERDFVGIEERHVERLEHEIDAWNANLDPLKSFILPGGGGVATVCHLARTVCRRAERQIVTLAAGETVRGEVQRYVNRLSDYLFVVARAAARELGHPEVLWDPART